VSAPIAVFAVRARLRARSIRDSSCTADRVPQSNEKFL